MDDLSNVVSLRQFEYLVAVVDLGSVSQAATLLHVSQPTISHQLASLERRLEVPLFDRVGRALQPTAAGRALARTGRDVLEVGRRGIDEARRAGSAREALTVAVVSSLAATVLPAALAAWHQSEPDVDVRIREHLRRDDLVVALQRSDDDIGIAAVPAGRRDDTVVLGEERYVLVVPPTSPLAGRRTPVALDRLAGAEWVLFDTDHGLHDLVQQACAQAGFSPRPAIRTRQIDTAVRLAAAGLGPALVPAISVPAEHAGLVVEPRPAIRRPVGAFGPGIDRPVARHFLALLTPDRTGLDAR